MKNKTRLGLTVLLATLLFLSACEGARSSVETIGVRYESQAMLDPSTMEMMVVLRHFAYVDEGYLPTTPVEGNVCVSTIGLNGPKVMWYCDDDKDGNIWLNIPEEPGVRPNFTVSTIVVGKNVYFCDTQYDKGLGGRLVLDGDKGKLENATCPYTKDNPLKPSDHSGIFRRRKEGI